MVTCKEDDLSQSTQFFFKVVEVHTNCVRARIYLCEALKVATTTWADDLEENPTKFKNPDQRAAITGKLIRSYALVEAHNSVDDLCENITESGYKLSKPLFLYYRDSNKGPKRTSLIPFMRAMANLSDTFSARLLKENPHAQDLPCRTFL